jgi:UPF0716 protein FxsA
MSTPPPVRPHPGPQRAPRRRSRARTVVPLVIAAWAVLEIWLFIVVAEATSGLTVLLLIIAGLVLGASAVKRAGRSAWRNLTAQVQAAQAQAGQGPDVATPPPAGTGRTGLAMLGGLLLIIPGLISDAAGLLLLLPPTRRLIGKAVDRLTHRALAARPATADPGSVGDLFQQARDANEQIRIHRPDGKVIPGEVVDRD